MPPQRRHGRRRQPSAPANRTGSPERAAQAAAGIAKAGCAAGAMTTWRRRGAEEAVAQRSRLPRRPLLACAVRHACVCPPAGPAPRRSRTTWAPSVRRPPRGSSASSACSARLGHLARVRRPGSARRPARPSAPRRRSRRASPRRRPGSRRRVAGTASVDGKTARATARGVRGRVAAADAGRVLGREGRVAELFRRLGGGRRCGRARRCADRRRRFRPVASASRPAEDRGDDEDDGENEHPAIALSAAGTGLRDGLGGGGAVEAGGFAGVFGVAQQVPRPSVRAAGPR